MNILVTGAGSGIGEGIALRLAGPDRKVIVTDRDAEAADRVAGKIRQAGFATDALSLDVTQQDQIELLATSTRERPIDVLINNAGIQHVARLEDFPRDRWEYLIQVMLTGVAMTTRAVLPAMRQQNFGRIINIGSVHSLVASPFKTAYIAAKHGLLGFSKSLALELAEAEITVNTICPAYVQTPMVDDQIAAQAKEHGMTEDEVVTKVMLEPMPRKSFITLEELAGTAEFLIGPAARNITAQTLVIDGGWTAR